MPAHQSATPYRRDPSLSFRHSPTRVRQLEAIGAHRSHENLTITLREAVDEYVTRHLPETAPSTPSPLQDI